VVPLPGKGVRLGTRTYHIMDRPAVQWPCACRQRIPGCLFGGLLSVCAAARHGMPAI